ncbi:uncharacterized protein CLAFUR5_07098 [Fulvia fulva]|uniref:Fungal N-terminal domain-containing protein n=1 Tax=Passalora fulva TaxID=5499 RepID=A0A9Q8PA82_PASFU|nr:uncharacterized protein CLAFUR5_07098 [Fulvia fulva]UJO18753.1 hypothetical protein CLAFUR5_07098 [Fulvia fulva]
MAFQPLSVGDILMLSQTAWKIGRAFTHGKKSAPSEFAEIEREANGLSDALKLVAETLHSDGSILSQADNDTKSAISAILESAHRTLDDLDSFVDRYQVIKKKETNAGFVVERSWSDVVLANYNKFKWTTEGGDVTELRNMLQMHTSSINLTMQALQSRSLARLEKTVVPMAENIASIHDRAHGDLGEEIDDLHRIIMSIATSIPRLQATDRAIESGSIRDSTSTVSTVEQITASYGERRMLEPPPPRSSSYQLPPRDVKRSPRGSPAQLAVNGSNGEKSSREDSAYYSVSSDRQPSDKDKCMDWDFETGSPVDARDSIGGHIEGTAGQSPNDSAYASSSRRASYRRESTTLPSLFRAVDEQYDAVAGSSRDEQNVDVSPRSEQRSWRSSADTDLLGAPAIPDKSDKRPSPPATPSSIFSRVSRSKSNIIINDRPRTAKSIAPSTRVWSAQVQSPNYTEGNRFERQLFRNAAILCDVRGHRVEYARENPDEPDPRYNVDMVDACKGGRICVIRKRENREHGGTRVTTSIWCLSDDGEMRIQHKLSDLQETVPYCSYFEPEKVSLQPAEGPIELKCHGDQWGDMLTEEIKTNWVNYYFASENDAVAFQSAVFGRLLIGSYRTTKTTVIHEGLKGAFAFEEQFANIEMLRLWEDDGVATAGAAGGVLALMHISSNFGEGWARWWINSSKQQVKVKDDGLKYAKVKGIDITVVRPGAAAAAERLRSPSSAASEIVPSRRNSEKNSPVKQVNGVKIEFKTEEERAKFVSAAKKAQMNTIPLPDL